MKTKKQQEYPVHEIRTFKDLGTVLTDENLDMIMCNFYGVAKAFLKAKKVYPELQLVGFDWIDDGKVEITEAKITVGNKQR